MIVQRASSMVAIPVPAEEQLDIGLPAVSRVDEGTKLSMCGCVCCDGGTLKEGLWRASIAADA